MNEQTKHTPGPWVLSLVCGGNYTLLPESHKKHPSHAIASIHENHGERNAANAALIAAAPELLEAAKFALSLLEISEVYFAAERQAGAGKSTEDLIRAAIAKAEGKESNV